MPRTRRGHPRAHPELEEQLCQYHHQWDAPPSPQLPADEVYGDIGQVVSASSEEHRSQANAP